jgi:hypothetical protein
LNFAGTSGCSRTVGSRENSRAHARTDTADAQKYPENDRREKKVRVFLTLFWTKLRIGGSRRPKPVWRIRDVYPGSDFFPTRIRIFFIPDPHQELSILTPSQKKV